MAEFASLIQSADWKKEKHVPVIECADTVAAGEFFDVKVSLGKEIAHPNTTEHHISYISLYFKPEGEKFAVHVGDYTFGAHGSSAAGANEGSVYTNHTVSASMKTTKAGELVALAYCNIHGLWESSKAIAIK